MTISEVGKHVCDGKDDNTGEGKVGQMTVKLWQTKLCFWRRGQWRARLGVKELHGRCGDWTDNKMRIIFLPLQRTGIVASNN
jgi:hypothetical protein